MNKRSQANLGQHKEFTQLVDSEIVAYTLCLNSDSANVFCISSKQIIYTLANDPQD